MSEYYLYAILPKSLPCSCLQRVHARPSNVGEGHTRELRCDHSVLKNQKAEFLEAIAVGPRRWGMDTVWFLTLAYDCGGSKHVP